MRHLKLLVHFSFFAGVKEVREDRSEGGYKCNV